MTRWPKNAQTNYTNTERQRLLHIRPMKEKKKRKWNAMKGEVGREMVQWKGRPNVSCKLVNGARLPTNRPKMKWILVSLRIFVRKLCLCVPRHILLLYCTCPAPTKFIGTLSHSHEHTHTDIIHIYLKLLPVIGVRLARVHTRKQVAMRWAQLNMHLPMKLIRQVIVLLLLLPLSYYPKIHRVERKTI